MQLPAEVAAEARRRLAEFRSRPFPERLAEMADALGMSTEEAKSKAFILTAFDVPLPFRQLERAVEAGAVAGAWTSVVVYAETDDGFPFTVYASPETDVAEQFAGLVALVEKRATRDDGAEAYGERFVESLARLKRDAASQAVILGFTVSAAEFDRSAEDAYANPAYGGFAISLDTKIGPVKPSDDIYTADQVNEYEEVWEARLSG